MGALQEIEQAVAAVAERAGPSVVGLGGPWASGSGFVLGDGLVATNAHNLRTSEVTVVFADGRSETGAVAGADTDGDLAVVRVDTGGAPALPWSSDGQDLRPGRVVLALANPGGRGTRTTLGAVSAVGRAFRGPRGRRIPGGVEHTAPLPRGSSGGPLVDAEGHLAGMNTHRLGDGFYLAIPADADLRARLEALSSGLAPRRPRLGVALAPARAARRMRAAVGLPERDGLLVRGVEDSSPADRAGLRRGDLLVAAAGRPLRSVDDLFAALDDAGDGSLELDVVRGSEEITVAVGVGETREEGSA